jgi:trans-aconitate 2-methyltransferase
MPRNFDAPSHVLLRETAEETRFAAALAGEARPRHGETMPLRRDPVRAPSFYYDLLRPVARMLDFWETEYLHVLEGEDPVLEWVRGSALRPLIEALAPDEARAFEARYGAKLRQAYPRRADGRTLLPFRRLFMVVRAQ